MKDSFIEKGHELSKYTSNIPKSCFYFTDKPHFPTNFVIILKSMLYINYAVRILKIITCIYINQNACMFEDIQDLNDNMK
jgi:hypothetical protein